MSTYKYVGMKYTQGDSNTELITFCAPADEIFSWGGVPAKNERFHGGFQRALSPRYKKIIDFFNSNQTSPGAIVVAFRKSVLQAHPLGLPSSWNSASLNYKPEFVQVEFDTEDDAGFSLAELRARVTLMLKERLKIDALSLDDDESIESTNGSEILENPETTDSLEQENGESDEEIDVGQSKLQDFFDFISSDERVNSWIATETARIEEIKKKSSISQQEKEYVAFSPEEKLKATLRSLLRPAMIVDGQHRVNGANESEKEQITFTVCAIKDADWVEQVFQFVVLNKMARPISKDFLTELLNTSLTNDEIKEIDTKLVAVGINNSDRIIHKYINHDPRSPFAGMVAEASESIGFEKAGKLSQQGMLAVAKRWRSISKGGKSLEMSMFMPSLGVDKLTLARKKWEHHDIWVPYFFSFWTVLKEQYGKEQVWVKAPNFHLLYIVTLQALQDVFLESKAEGDARFQSIGHFEEQVRDFFESVPASFFQNWSATGLQSGSGWEDIKSAIRLFRKGQKLATVKSNSPLFG